MSYIVRAYQSADFSLDNETQDCDNDHTYERMNPYTGTFSLYTEPCRCFLVPVGIVNGRKRFSVRSSGSEFDDLPF